MVLTLEFYGVACRIACAPILAEALRKDFAYFVSDSLNGAADISLEFYQERPPFERVPFIGIPFPHPDWTARDRGAVRYVDYRGQALGIYDYRCDRGELYAEKFDLLREIAYLMVHSRVGELMDRKGLHRVHAMGVTVDGRSVLCLLPQGGGKTTLCLELLKRDGVRLLSDDTPVITAQGEILPFPSRIGVCAPADLEIPPRYLSEFRRRRHGTKTLIDAGYYGDRISPATKPDLVLVGERCAGGSRLKRVRGTQAFMPFMMNCVLGIGLPQVMEYFVRFDAADLAGKMRIVRSRLRASRRLIRRAEVYRFCLGTDIRANADIVMAAVKKKGKIPAA